MTDYGFYISEYKGGTVPPSKFDRFARRASEQLERYKRRYTVTSTAPDSEDMAVCAMADALYFFETAQNSGTVSSVSVGSVSTAYALPQTDISAAAVSRKLLDCAELYLDIYRGCAGC